MPEALAQPVGLRFLPESIEIIPVSELVPYVNNPRTHSDDQIARLAASIVEFGWTMPILVDDDLEIIAGHGRLAAARLLGLDEVPVIRLAHLTEQQIRAVRLADNKLAEDSGWDQELLAMEFHDLNSVNYDLALTGFSEDEIDALLAPLDNEGLTDPDDAPEVSDAPISKIGDLWICGNHRILCGDATVSDDVKMLLAGAVPHLMVTDPPYGVDYDPDWRNRADLANGKPYGDRAVGLVTNDDQADWSDAYALFPGDVAYIWHAGINSSRVIESIERSGFALRAQIIWAKSHFPIGRGHYHVQHEPCWYAVRNGATGHWQGDRTQSTLWQIDKPMKSETGHSTQKPVECMRRPIENNSMRGETVYDPFLGSGTTMISAESTGRSCYGVEIAPQYVDVAVRRWQDFTGEKATLSGDGRTFDEIANARATADA